MPALDWLFLIVLLVSLVLGAWRGLVYEVLALIAWIAAFFLAQWFAPAVAQRLPMGGSAEVIRYAASFVLVFVVAVFAGGLLAALARRLFAAIGLRPVDRMLGAAFGLIRGLVLLLSATVVVGMTPLQSAAWWQESNGVGVAVVVLKGLKPVLPQEFGKYLPS